MVTLSYSLTESLFSGLSSRRFFTFLTTFFFPLLPVLLAVLRPLTETHNIQVFNNWLLQLMSGRSVQTGIKI